MKWRRSSAFQLVLCSIFILLCGQSRAQIKKTYTGPYKVNQSVGQAIFDYTLNNADSILDGSYKFKAENLSGDFGEDASTFDVTGHFSQNRPSDEWIFSYLDIQPSSSTQLVDYKYVTTLDGSEDKVIGSFVSGKAQGRWNLFRIKIENSVVADTIFSSSINYDDGVPKLSAMFRQKSSSLVARFLRDGHAHDQWSLFLDDEIDPPEEWSFEDGRLTHIHLANKNISQAIFELDDTSFVDLPLGKQFLTILSLSYPNLDSLGIFDSGISSLIRTNSDLLDRAESAFSTRSSVVNLKTFQVKVPVYPLTLQDRKTVEGIKSKTKAGIDLASAILSNSQLNITKLSDEETAFYFKIAEILEEQFLNPLNRIRLYDDHGVLPHVEEGTLCRRLFPASFPSLEVFSSDLDGVKKSFSVQNTKAWKSEEYTFANLDLLADFALNSLADLSVKLSTKVSLDIREKEIVSEEELLFSKAQAFQKLLGSTKILTNEKIAMALDTIDQYSESELTSYSKMEDSEEKLKKAIDLENCYEKMTALVLSLGELPAQEAEIKEIYMDEVWNPFTSTLMDESVKKRITKAYEEVLIPHLMSGINQQVGCSNAANYAEMFEKYFARMKVLRDVDTKKLERKLKRKTNPEEVIAILGMQ